MAERLYYNGVDITNEVKVIAATIDQYTGSERADTMELVFSDEDGWGSWKPKTDDQIRYIRDGSDSGTMYIYDMSLESSLTVLYVTSTPITMRTRKTKAWEQVYLTQIGKEIAERSGMSFEMVNLADQYYSYIKQEKETDAAFLGRLAMLEGAALLIYNGRVILAKESELEAKDPTAYLDLNGGYYEYYDRSNEAYGSATLTVGQYKGVSIADKNNTKQYNANADKIQASSDSECTRFAAGVLRNKNKGLTNFTLKTTLMLEIAAGITCELEDAPTGWSGSLFVHHVRHEFHKTRTIVFARKPLEGY
ncbi:MAG: hypothetical protein MRZ45_09185 [Blautia sp.]|nr:hypothetical protein [Blautia sp.]